MKSIEASNPVAKAAPDLRPLELGRETSRGDALAIVVVPDVRKTRAHSSGLVGSDRMAEAVALARAIGLEIAHDLIAPMARPRADTLLASGKVAEIGALVAQSGALVVIVDHALSPVQQRNLERAWHAKVLDRTALILEIFGARARTREGRLQVELAHLDYQKSRLVRSWTHLERQRGGRGFMGGPGERQIEADRRQIQDRIDAIRRNLGAVKRTRGLHRDSRKRVPYPVVALVGYTNAGKSTLFNRLTGASVFAEDQVFATLDPTMRGLDLPGGKRIILSDTVGFIADLPTTLIAAFQATLEEVTEADIIVHVRDIASAQTESEKHDVERVLAQLGIDMALKPRHVLEVWNKLDLLDAQERLALRRRAARLENQPILISARSGEGINELYARLARLIDLDKTEREVVLQPGDGALLSWLHRNCDIVSQETEADGTLRLCVRGDRRCMGRLSQRLASAAPRPAQPRPEDG